MSYYVYHKTDSRIATGKGNRSHLDHEYATEGAAKAAITRIVKKANARYEELMASPYTWDHEKAARVMSNTKDLSIAESTDYHENIEQFEWVTPMMSKSGKKIRISVNTPNYMNPACESYWTM